MGDFFPELKKNPKRVADVIRDEEESFGRTLEQGTAHFAEAAEAGGIAAEDAFKLHDTYGFPIDLTQIMAAEHGLTVDVEGFERLMEQARERSRAGGAGASCEAKALHMDAEAVAELQKRGVKPTDDSLKFDRPRATAHVQAIWTGDTFVDHLDDSRDEPVAIILDRTTFYAEMGGQVGDVGTLHADVDTGDGQIHILFDVENTASVAGYVLHVGRLAEGAVAVGNAVETRVDERRRRAVAANHTTTHLLNLALREALGEGVEQKGSLVAPDRLRFDFSASSALDDETLARIERVLVQRIDQDLEVHAAEAPLAEARRINGVRAVFGETYPDPVRVVSIGAPVADLLVDPESDRWRELSIEFCGGTHLLSTGEATAVAVTEETAVAKGVRRITALTGDAAQDAIKRAEQYDARVQGAKSLEGDALQQEVTDLAERIETETLPLTFKHRARAELESLSERVKAARKQAAAAGRDAAVAAARQIAETAEGEIVIAEIPAGSDRQALLAAMDAVRARHEDAAIMLLSADHDEGKVSIAAAVPKPLIDRGLRAGDWVRAAAGACGGKGGGKPDKAQGGGTEPDKLEHAMAAARDAAGEALSSGAV
jgi:alanyl-tRNA synthetase